MTIKNLVPKLSREREHLPVRYAPEVDPFRSFQWELNRLFHEFPLAPRWGWRGLSSAEFTPLVDVSETDREVRVTVELPGLDEKDLTLELDEESLTIRGEKREEKEEKGRDWYTREQSYGSFHRLIRLPASVDGTRATAKFRKGVLTVTVPKLEASQSKRRTIKIVSE